MQTADVLILGAGAAGLMCAIEAGKNGARVLLLDHADRVGKKILISGGGRSNFTNLHTSPENFLSENPHFAKSALARYTPQDFIDLVEKHKLSYHEKTLGQLFCDGSAQGIVTMLQRECADVGVVTRLGVQVQRIEQDGRFTVQSPAGIFQAPALVVATGGPSIPKMGATGFGYDMAKQFGMNVIQPRPALVPIVFSETDREGWCDLAGVTMEVMASSGAGSFRERMLFTHKGLSGPAGLQVSSYWRGGQAVVMDLAPGREVFRKLLETKGYRDGSMAFAALREVLPARLAERWLEMYATGWGNKVVQELERRLHAWEITPVGTEGYVKAEVTAGGVDTRGLDAKTMESRTVPGLYFIGEVVDVTGWLGGYNFQWAWASGAAAGRAISSR